MILVLHRKARDLMVMTFGLTRALASSFRCLGAMSGFIFFTSGAPATADGNVIDRTDTGHRYKGGLFTSGTINSVPIGMTFQLEVQCQDSDDGSNWDDFGPPVRGPLYVGDGGTNVPAAICVDVQIEGARQFLRTQMTPLFTGVGTAQIFITPALLLYASSQFPADP